MGARLPFHLRGSDTDNGHEFINHHLPAYVRQLSEPIEFTRSRARKKNDNAHVEQKNATHVWEQVGYERFDHPALAEPLRRFYEAYERFRNLFIPCFKLPSAPDTRPPRQPPPFGLRYEATRKQANGAPAQRSSGVMVF